MSWRPRDQPTRSRFSRASRSTFNSRRSSCGRRLLLHPVRPTCPRASNLSGLYAKGLTWSHVGYLSRTHLPHSGLVKRLIEGATSREVGTALPHYASLLARIILASPSSFLLLLAQAGVPLETFLDLWWAAFDRLALSSMRKRCALASAALCATGEPAVLSRFGELLNVFLDVLGELKETEADAAGDQAANIGSSLNLHWKRGADAPVAGDAEGTAEGERLQAVRFQPMALSVHSSPS